MVQSPAFNLAYVRPFVIFPALEKKKSQVSLASGVPRHVLRHGLLKTQKFPSRAVAHMAYMASVIQKKE